MPKELHEIKTFLTGTITSPDAKDIPEDAAQESLNIDPVSSDGKLIGIGKDEVITDYIEDAVSFDSNSMKVTNVQGQRNLIGISDNNNKIRAIGDLYGSKTYSTHSTITPEAIGDSSNFNIEQSSMIVDNNNVYAGLGGVGASRPKFAGRITNKQFGETFTSILIEDAEAKPFKSGYYGVEKVVSTIPSDGNEDDYVWGLAPGEKFLFRISVKIPGVTTEGTLTASNYIKDTFGNVLDDTLVSIATCISQEDMLWAIGRSGRIYRLKVNESSLDVTIQLRIKPFFLKSNLEDEDFNINNKAPSGTLSDIIEVRNYGNDLKHSLFISFYKEDGFNPRESYLYERVMTPWDNSLTVDDSTLEDPFSTIVLDGQSNIVTQNIFENFLFSDISVIFNKCYQQTTNYGEFENITLYWNDNMQIDQSEDQQEEGYIPQSVVEVGDESYDATEHFPVEQYYKGFKLMRYSSTPSYDIVGTVYNNETWVDAPEDDPDAHVHYDTLPGQPIIVSAAWATQYNHFDTTPEGTPYTSGTTPTFDLGGNLGFIDDFKLHVHKYGLIGIYNTESGNEPVDPAIDPYGVTVGLYAYSDAEFVTKGGKIIGRDFVSARWTHGHTKGEPIMEGLFFGAEAGETESFPHGFFIVVNDRLKVVTKASHDVVTDPSWIAQGSYGNDINVKASSSCVPFSGSSGGDNKGASLLLGLSDVNSNTTAGNGGFGNNSGVELESYNEGWSVESVVHDIIGTRLHSTIDTLDSGGFTPDTYNNLVFITESVDTDGNDHVDSTRFWTVNLDSVTSLVDGSGEGIDFVKQGLTSATTYIGVNTENDLGGAVVYPIYDSADDEGGSDTSSTGNNTFNLWYFSRHSTDTNNYENGILPLIDNSGYLQWGTKVGKQTTYPSMTFNDIEGDGNNFDAGDEVFYKIALMYDNGAVSKLNKQEWQHAVNTSALDTISVTIKLGLKSISRRVSNICLFRRIGADSSIYDLAVIPISTSSGWSKEFNSNDPPEVIYRTVTVHDRNDPLAVYTEFAGLSDSEVTNVTLPNYSLSTMVSSFHIIGKCHVPNMDDYTNYLFKSNAGVYNVFNIADPLTFCKLPTTPTAVKSFGGRIFAFDENNTYIVNPEGMYVEDELEGIGCLSRHSAVMTEFSMFFADNSNIYQYDGTKTIPLGNSILTGNKYSWFERDRDFDPILAFDGTRLSLVVIFKIKDEDKYFTWTYNIRLKRWDRWELPSGTPLSAVSGKNGEVIISTSENLVFYTTNGDEKRNWSWLSKDITLGEDAKFKKLYKVSTFSSGDNNDYLSYKTDDNDFVALGDDNSIKEKAKSVQLKIESQGDNLEVDSVSLTFRRLPNSDANIS